MTGIRELAEPLHMGSLTAHTDGYNAGLDALVDAVEQSGMVLIPGELVKRLAAGLEELDHYLSTVQADSNFRLVPKGMQPWTAATQIVDIARELP